MDIVPQTFPTNWQELRDALEHAYNQGKTDTTQKLQCCANCKHCRISGRCGKWHSGECRNYECWEEHNYDSVEM